MSASIIHSPYRFACDWYDVESIHRSINARHSQAGNDHEKIPIDVCSLEFAEWLAEQYRLAMAKGAQLAIEELRQK